MDKNQKKILIVEDDLDLQNLLFDRLSASNYSVYRASDGEEAVTALVDKKPHLVLLDLLLPKLDGFHVLDRLRHYPEDQVANTKVVVLSNLWSDKDILRAQALKVDEYYVKANTNLDEVYSKIADILNKL